MPTTRWLRIKRVFQAAMDIPPDRRDEYLSAACREDAGLRCEVESLLSHHSVADGFIEPPRIESVARAFESAETRSHVGMRVGAYELVRPLDSGGMGHVYLACRADGQFERTVAIKLIRRAVDGADLRRRFLIEQKALAALDHPHIARLLDGGLTDEGLPYLVMEYVEGVAIDEFCRANALPLEKKLELFRDVCEAVHFAHQRLVIHRDLKPSNILVTGEGVPKLLDFGVAKLVVGASDRLRPRSQRLSIPFMTPEYASPEQLRGEPITTAGDIYSLGVILFELLTGRRPQEFDTHSHEEIVRRVCHEPPPKPSTVVRSVSKHVSGTAIPGQSHGARRGRRAHPSRRDSLRRGLVGDLDNVCLMALRKEPHRRYGSADQFAEDIRRHLVGLPVIARRDTFGYRAAKFVKRHRAAVFAASVLLFALIAGVVTTSIALVYVQRAQEKTLRMNEFLNQMLAQADINNVGRDLTVREMLDRAARRVESDFKDHPDVEAGLRAAIGNAYLSLRAPEAEAHLRAAYDIRRRIHGDLHQDVADSLHDLAVMEYNKSNLAEAERLSDEALDTQRRLTGEIDTHYAAILDDFAVFVRSRGEYARAETMYKKVLALNRHLYGPHDVRTAQTLNNYGLLLKLEGHLDRAEQMYRESVDIRRKQPGQHHALATSLSNLAALLHAKGDFQQAEPIYREALALQKNLLGTDHPGIAVTENNLAMLLVSIARYDEAERLFQRSLETNKARLGRDHPQVATALYNLGSLYQQLGRYAEAESLLRESHKVRLSTLGPDHPDGATSLFGLGSLAMDLKNTEEAGRLLTQALDLRRRLFPKGHPVTAATLDQLARLSILRGNYDVAEQFARQSLDMRKQFLHADHPDVASGKIRLGGILAHQRRFDVARVLLNDGLRRLRAKLGEAHPLVMQALYELGELAAASGDPKTARIRFEESYRIGRDLLGPRHPDVLKISQRLEALDAVEKARRTHHDQRIAPDYFRTDSLPIIPWLHLPRLWSS